MLLERKERAAGVTWVRGRAPQRRSCPGHREAGPSRGDRTEGGAVGTRDDTRSTQCRDPRAPDSLPPRCVFPAEPGTMRLLGALP